MKTLPLPHTSAVPIRAVGWRTIGLCLVLALGTIVAAVYYITQLAAAKKQASDELQVALQSRREALQDKQRLEQLLERAKQAVRAVAAEQEKRLHDQRSALPDSPPDPPPPRFRAVMNPDFPSDEIAQLTSSSATAAEKAIYRLTDINNDGKMEMMIAGIEGTCRQDGCPVFLVIRARCVDCENPKAELRDVLPNNYDFNSVSVLDHTTNGFRDLMVTQAPLEDTLYRPTAPAERKCRRLTWDPSTERYVFQEKEPSADECFEAEKRAWNLLSDYRARPELAQMLPRETPRDPPPRNASPPTPPAAATRMVPQPPFEPFFTEEIAKLTASSFEAAQNAPSHPVDINDDGKNELLVGGIEGTCRRDGCPVFLVIRTWCVDCENPKAELRDVLPNNYDFNTVSVLDHMTNGFRDLMVTEAPLEDTLNRPAAPAERKCRRLTWDLSTERYVFQEKEPSADECFEAEKRAWNLLNDYRARPDLTQMFGASRRRKTRRIFR